LAAAVAALLESGAQAEHPALRLVPNLSAQFRLQAGLPTAQEGLVLGAHLILVGKVQALVEALVEAAARPFLVAAGRLAAGQDEPMEALAGATLILAALCLAALVLLVLFCLSTKP
jgi:hypothetical protein